MDQHTSSSIISSSNTIPPAQLWLGAHDHLVDKVIHYLQSLFCSHHGCGVCIACEHIRNQQHHAIRWFLPDKQYTVDDIEPITQSMSFGLNNNDLFFFILQKSDYLSSACANKLLKSIEEPPPGYHIIFLAERKESILATIRSRCIISVHSSEQKTLHHTLLTFFTYPLTTQPSEFLKELEACKINEQESLELLDYLFAYWLEQYKNATDTKKATRADQIINIIKQHLITPPMPGSSKIFWKNLFLLMYQ